MPHDGRCFKPGNPSNALPPQCPMTAGATTEGTSLRVRHFDGTETDTAEWTHRNALPPPCPIPHYPFPITHFDPHFDKMAGDHQFNSHRFDRRHT
ncbi:MAG: hypothetical protein KME31_21485 [Tolypothrix carrinoi HA7290-LM1]|nr:hypothetical protein [Tolypothrix carrinoi HA7290-LM1]